MSKYHSIIRVVFIVIILLIAIVIIWNPADNKLVASLPSFIKSMISLIILPTISIIYFWEWINKKRSKNRVSTKKASRARLTDIDGTPRKQYYMPEIYPREINTLLLEYFQNSTTGHALIVGFPSSGKTRLIFDVIRQLNKYYFVVPSSTAATELHLSEIYKYIYKNKLIVILDDYVNFGNEQYRRQLLSLYHSLNARFIITCHPHQKDDVIKELLLPPQISFDAREFTIDRITDETEKKKIIEFLVDCAKKHNVYIDPNQWDCNFGSPLIPFKKLDSTYRSLNATCKDLLKAIKYWYLLGYNAINIKALSESLAMMDLHGKYINAEVVDIVKELDSYGFISYNNHEIVVEEAYFRTTPLIDQTELANQNSACLMNRKGFIYEDITPQDAIHVLGNIVKENVIFYNNMILSSSGFSEAVEILEEMKTHQIKPNIYNFNSISSKATSDTEVKQLIEIMFGQPYNYNTIPPGVIAALVKKSSSYATAKANIEDPLIDKKFVFSNVVLSALVAKCDDYSEADELLKKAISDGLIVTSTTYSALLTKCRDYDVAKEIFYQALDKEKKIVPHMYTAFIANTNFSPQQRKEIFREAEKHGLDSNIIICSAYMSVCGKYNELREIYDRLCDNQIKLDRNIITIMLSKSPNYDTALEYYQLLEERGELDVAIENVMLDKAIKEHNVNNISIHKRELLKKPEFLNTLAVTTLIKSSNTLDEAMNYYMLLCQIDQKPDINLYTSLINKCNPNTFEEVEPILKEYINKYCLPPDDVFLKALFKKLTADDAKMVFNLLKEKFQSSMPINTILWIMATKTETLKEFIKFDNEIYNNYLRNYSRPEHEYFAHYLYLSHSFKDRVLVCDLYSKYDLDFDIRVLNKIAKYIRSIEDFQVFKGLLAKYKKAPDIYTYQTLFLLDIPLSADVLLDLVKEIVKLRVKIDSRLFHTITNRIPAVCESDISVQLNNLLAE